jgi:hypothetical protein
MANVRGLGVLRENFYALGHIWQWNSSEGGLVVGTGYRPEPHGRRRAAPLWIPAARWRSSPGAPRHLDCPGSRH